MAKRVWRRLTQVKRREIYRLAILGRSRDLIAREVGQSYGAVSYVLAPLGGVIRASLREDPTGHRLSMADRMEIFAALREGVSFTVIAGRIGFDVSTVSREVGGVAGRDMYRQWSLTSERVLTCADPSLASWHRIRCCARG